MIRVSEGKYRIGDTQTLIFVRVSPKRCELCKYIFIAKKLVGNAVHIWRKIPTKHCDKIKFVAACLSKVTNYAWHTSISLGGGRTP